MIEWISVHDKLPPMHEAKDEDGYTYHVSAPLLVWDGSEDEPVAIGTYEDGQFFAFGIAQYTVTHWAPINDPEGKIVNGDFRGGW